MWIVLHDTNGELRLNFSNVLMFRKFAQEPLTVVVTAGTGSNGLVSYYVSETPEEIENMIIEEQRRLTPAR